MVLNFNGPPVMVLNFSDPLKSKPFFDHKTSLTSLTER